jgi:hypothetical protein
MFRISSVHSDRELLLSNYSGQNFSVELRGDGLKSRVQVWTDEKITSLVDFFKDLATFQKPWPGSKKWESLEGEFSISAECSITGNITFTIELFHQSGSNEEALVKAGLVSEFGQLANFARDAKTFFCQ